MKNYLSTIILFICVLGLAGYIFFIEKNNMTTDEYKEFELKLIKEQNPIITKINLLNKIILEKKKKWRIYKPYSREVDKNSIERLLNSITNLKKKGELQVKNLLKYGIDADSDSYVSFKTQTNTYTIFIGDKLKLDKGCFVYIKEKDKVYVCENIKGLLDFSFNKLRNKKLLDIKDNDTVKAISYYKKNTELKFIKENANDNEKFFKLIKPHQFKADWYKVNELINSISNITLNKFYDNVESPELKNILGDKWLKVSIENDSKIINIDFYTNIQDTDLILCKADNLDYYGSINKDDLSKFIVEYYKFKNTNLYNFKKENPDNIKLFSSDEQINLMNKSGTFVIEDQNNFNDTETLTKINDFMTNLNFIKIENFISDNPAKILEYNLDNPAYKIITFQKKNETSKVLLIGKNEDNEYYSMFADENYIFTLNKDFIEQIDEIIKLKK